MDAHELQPCKPSLCMVKEESQLLLSSGKTTSSKTDEPIPQLIMMREIQTEGDVTLSIKVHTGSLQAGGADKSAAGRSRTKGQRTKTTTHTAMYT
jgi:hypothetical protein